MSTDLRFRLILNADSNNLVQNLERSTAAAERMFENIRQESDRLRQSMQLSQEVGTLVQSIDNARRTIDETGNSSVHTREQLEEMAQGAALSIQRYEQELNEARLQLNLLAATNATPVDIRHAQEQVAQLERSITQTRTAVNAYQDACSRAAAEPPVPTQLQQDVASTVTELENARLTLDAVGNSSVHTREQLEQMTQRASTQIEAYERDLGEARLELNRLSATNATPEDIQTAQARIQELETGISQTRTSLNGFRGAANQATNELEQGLSRANQTTESFRNTIGNTKFILTGLFAAMATIGVGVSIQGLVDVTDTYTNLSAKINIATREHGNFEEAMAGVHRVAIATNSNLTSTADLFTRLNTVGKDMGMTQQQALDLTQTVTQAIQIGGSSAEAADGAVVQFIQAMQGGVLRGEEFNSIMEGGFGLAEALARGLGVTTGELRKMAEAGELSAERVIKALEGQKEKVSQIYGQFPTTIGNALQRIQTQWQTLIGEMDQANGASAKVAQWLVVLADNIQELSVFIEDIGEGFVWFGDQLKNIDPTTINVIKETLGEVYEVVKKNIADIAILGETIWSAFTTALDVISPLFAALLSGKDDVSGLEVALNMLRMAFAAISDVGTGLNIGLKLLLAGIQFLSGGLYALSSQVLDFLGFDTLARQALNASDRMFAQAEKNATGAVELAKNHEWAVIKTYNEIGKTQEQKNAEQVANNQKALDEIKAQEEKHKADYKSISDERIKLSQQLYDAQKSGNQDAIDAATFGLTKLQEKETAFSLEKKQLDNKKIASAKEYAESVILGAGEQDKALTAATKQTINTELATRGLKAEFDAMGQVSVAALEGLKSSTDNLSASTDKARKAATALGIDLDVSLNRVSEKFIENSKHVNTLVDNLAAMKLTGKESADAIYEGWRKWLETAKSQAEVDVAKAKLKEFGEQGKLSTAQVEAGMQALRNVIQKLPSDLDLVEQAFERLGIKTKEQLNLAAQIALSDFDTVRASGKATADQLQQAYERVVQAAYASGDASIKANANAKASSLGLQIQVDETGKATVTSANQMAESMDRVHSSIRYAQQGFRELGDVARQEAKSSIEAWNEAMQAKSKAEDEKRAESRGKSRDGGSYTSYSRASVEAELQSMGYSAAEAKKLASSIMSDAITADKSAMHKNMGTGNSAMLNEGFKKLMDQGLTTSYGSQVVNERLNELQGGNALATMSAPEPQKMVNYNIEFGGKMLSLSGTAEQESVLNALVKELNAQAKTQ